VADLVLIDTDVLIDAGRGEPEAITCLQELAGQRQLAVSAVTQMELIVGCRNKADLRTVQRFLARFEIVPLNPHVSDTAVELLRRYRLSHGLLVADALIAATAAWLNVPLLSKNKRDYRFIKEVELLDYPQPSH
jgi:predicted nucleic acid-binding protein